MMSVWCQSSGSPRKARRTAAHDREKARPGPDPGCEAVCGKDHAQKNMSIELYLVFVLATALLIATPGPNVALIVGTSLTHGARTGLIAMAGVNTGVMIQLAVVAAGPARIVGKFSPNFGPIRLFRAGHLLFLRISNFLEAPQAGAPPPPSSARA